MKNLKRALEKFGKETTQLIRRDIRYKKLVKTGKLVGSIELVNTWDYLMLQSDGISLWVKFGGAVGLNL